MGEPYIRDHIWHDLPVGMVSGAFLLGIMIGILIGALA